MQCAHAVDRRKQGLSRGEEGLLRLAHKMGAWDVRLSFRASRAPAEYCLAREASVKQRAARCTDREVARRGRRGEENQGITHALPGGRIRLESPFRFFPPQAASTAISLWDWSARSAAEAGPTAEKAARTRLPWREPARVGRQGSRQAPPRGRGERVRRWPATAREKGEAIGGRSFFLIYLLYKYDPELVQN